MTQELFKLVRAGNLTEIQTKYEENPNIITEPYEFSKYNDNGYSYIAHSPIADWLFHAACIDGHLHIVKWLLQVKPDINISDENEKAFLLACDFNHLQLAKWLLQVKPDINVSASKDIAFRSASFQDRVKMAQWLHQIRPYHYILELNDKNQIIHYEVRKFAERKWLERREPLMAHYNKKEEKNVFWCLPKVVVRNICEYV
jgi:hypothetical protein